MLPREARQVLAEMELLSYGKCASLNASTRGGEDLSRPPQGEAHPAHILWRTKMERCSTAELSSVIQAAWEELQSIRRRDIQIVVPEETRDQWEVRLIEEGEGHEAKAVAQSFSCAVATVTKLRKREGRDPNTGYVVGTPRERARKLWDAGLNQQQIARALDVSQPTVSRLLAA